MTLWPFAARSRHTRPSPQPTSRVRRLVPGSNSKNRGAYFQYASNPGFARQKQGTTQRAVGQELGPPSPWGISSALFLHPRREVHMFREVHMAEVREVL